MRFQPLDRYVDAVGAQIGKAAALQMFAQLPASTLIFQNLAPCRPITRASRRSRIFHDKRGSVDRRTDA